MCEHFRERFRWFAAASHPAANQAHAIVEVHWRINAKDKERKTDNDDVFIQILRYCLQIWVDVKPSLLWLRSIICLMLNSSEVVNPHVLKALQLFALNSV